MRKLLIIGAALNCGAPGHITEQIGLLAKLYGWEVYQAHGMRHVNPSRLKTIAVSSKIEEYFHFLQAFLFDEHGLGSERGTLRLVEQIKQIRPDVINIHNLHGYFINFKVLFDYLSTTNIPVVWTMHDCWPFTGRCFHFIGCNCYKWKVGCYNCKSETGYTVSRFWDRSNQLFFLKKQLFTSIHNMFLVPVSEWLGAFLKDSFLSKYPSLVIHNGVDIKKFMPVVGNRLREKLGLNNKFILLGVASPWSTRKGLDDFIVLRRQLSNDYAIVLVGLSQKQIDSLPEGIIGIKKTEDQHELAEYYSMADVFVNLSYLDTFPTVNLESLACGTPVLTYRTGGSPEAIDEKTGVVVEQGDFIGLVTAISKMRDNPMFPEDCRRRVERFFDKDKCFKKYIELFDKIINDDIIK